MSACIFSSCSALLLMVSDVCSFSSRISLYSVSIFWVLMCDSATFCVNAIKSSSLRPVVTGFLSSSSFVCDSILLTRCSALAVVL